MNFVVRTLASCAIATVSSLLPPISAAQSEVTVVEYYSTVIGSYFITGRPLEQQYLDTIPEFRRTNATFTAFVPNASLPASIPSICRFQVKLLPSAFSSHFYGLPIECDLYKQLKLPEFIDEGLDFAIRVPNASGVCPAEAPIAIRRAFRPTTTANAANHRYTTSQATYDSMLGLGWNGEGVVYCTTNATDETPRPTFTPFANLSGSCAVPRTGNSPLTGNPYPDRQGTIDDEKQWLRSYADQTYLWWRETPNVTLSAFSSPQQLFPALKSPTLLFSGNLKDRYSFFESTADEERSRLGRVYGYGFSLFAIRRAPPRVAVLAIVDPNSPAALSGLKRGDRLVRVDGVDFVNDNTQTGLVVINRGLWPPTVGESHVLEFAPADGSANRIVTLNSADLPIATVPQSNVIQTPTGRVGYVHLTTFGPNTAEKALADAIAGLNASGGVQDLVLDLRYNGGGQVITTAQLGYMIAGPQATAGKRFTKLTQNEKKPFGGDSEVPFVSTGSGNAGGVAASAQLPSLGLRRVYIITTGGSASASEYIINGLRGIDVEVILIGQRNFGKPVGQFVVDNCGMTVN
ncbi:MAG: S41 family peptidase, partial [Casimicrobium sp.]